MKDYLNRIYEFERKCVNEVYNILNKNKLNGQSEYDLSDYPFYVSMSVIHCGCSKQIAVRVDKLRLDEYGDIQFCGTDTYGNEYEFGEGDDIISFMGFDMYNAVFQKETAEKAERLRASQYRVYFNNNLIETKKKLSQAKDYILEQASLLKISGDYNAKDRYEICKGENKRIAVLTMEQFVDGQMGEF